MTYDCAPIDQVFAERGAVVVPFDYGSNAWLDVPDDLKLSKRIEFPAGGGIWEYKSKSTGRRFLLWWWDYEPSTAADGSRNGNHHFCGMYELKGE